MLEKGGEEKCESLPSQTTSVRELAYIGKERKKKMERAIKKGEVPRYSFVRLTLLTEREKKVSPKGRKKRGIWSATGRWSAVGQFRAAAREGERKGPDPACVPCEEEKGRSRSEHYYVDFLMRHFRKKKKGHAQAGAEGGRRKGSLLRHFVPLTSLGRPKKREGRRREREGERGGKRRLSLHPCQPLRGQLSEGEKRKNGGTGEENR